MKIQKRKSIQKTILYSTSVVLLVAIFVFSSYTIFKNTSVNNTPDQSNQSRDVNEVDYSGPSPEDTESSQDAKKRAGENNTEKNTTLNKKIASVGVVYADIEGDNFEIRAFTSSVIEGDGICTATLKNGNNILTGTSRAFVDATSSQCRPIQIPLSSISPRGEWKLSVSYKSETAEGSSQEEIINI